MTDTSFFTWLSDFIGNNAFPIVMCILLFLKINEQDKRHRESEDTMRTALENNTQVLTELKLLIGGSKK